MAHTCPECGQACYCNGDIDDCVFDFEENVVKCNHWRECCTEEYMTDDELQEYCEDDNN